MKHITIFGIILLLTISIASALTTVKQNTPDVNIIDGTYISSTNPTTSYGTETDMKLRSQGNIHYSYVKIRPTNMPPHYIITD